MNARSPDPYTTMLRRGFVRQGECLLIRGSRTKNGYVQIGASGKRYSAHRTSYQKWHGPIPDGLVIDHICHNEAVARGECHGGFCDHRACVNPAHLRAVTQVENDQASPLSLHWKKNSATHCPQDHPYDENNTYWHKGNRYCRMCSKASALKRYHKKASANG